MLSLLKKMGHFGPGVTTIRDNWVSDTKELSALQPDYLVVDGLALPLAQVILQLGNATALYGLGVTTIMHSWVSGIDQNNQALSKCQEAGFRLPQDLSMSLL